MPSPKTSFDVAIVGAGQAGVPLANALVKQDRSVVLFERDRLGGSCVNYGCTPSKAFIAAAHAAAAIRRADRFGLHADLSVDGERVMDRVRAIRDEWRSGVKDKIDDRVHVVDAEASFVGERRLEADGRSYAADLVVLDTGSRPRSLDGFEGDRVLTERSLWDLERLPDRMAVIGGGAVGLEVGQAFARLGCDVTLVERGDRVLASEDEAVSKVLHRALERDGVEIVTDAEATVLAHEPSFVRLGIGDRHVDVDHVLLATGRTPNADALQLDAAGIERRDDGTIRIDDRMRTACAGVYAVGEVAGQPQFTHAVWEDHLRLLSILEGGDRRRGDRALAYGVFTDPQVGRVGIAGPRTDADRQIERDVRSMSRAREWGHEDGFFRLVVDADDRLRGATFVGYEAAELVHIVAPLVQAGEPVDTLQDTVAAHPTYAEEIRFLAR